MNPSNPQSDDRLSAYLDGELAADERADFEKLLQQRADYREMLERLQRMRSGFAELPRHDLTTDLSPKIIQRIREVDPGATPSSEHEHSTSSVEAVVRRTPIAAPKTVVAVVGVLAASIALMLIFWSDRDGRDLAKAPAGTVAEPLNSRHDLDEAEAAGHQLAQVREPEEGSSDEAGRMRSEQIERQAEKSAVAGSVLVEDHGMVDKDDMPSQDDRPRQRGMRRVNQVASKQPPPAPAAQMYGDHVPAVPPIAADAETMGQRMMGESRASMALDSTTAAIPSIVIQTQSDESYRQLVAAISQARLETRGRDDRSEEAYSQMRESFGGTSTPAMAAEVKPVQVIEVTTTQDIITQLIATAREQRAIISNAVEYHTTVVPSSGKREKAIANNGPPAAYSFSGTVNRWRLLPSSETGLSAFRQVELDELTSEPARLHDLSSRDLSLSPKVDSQVPKAFVPLEDAATRWRILILPVSQVEPSRASSPLDSGQPR